MAYPTKNEVIEYVNDVVAEIAPYVESTFHVDVLKTKITFSMNESRNLGVAGHHGGKPTMTLFIADFTRFAPLGFREYANIGKKAPMRGFATSDWKLVARALVLHEISHVIQYQLKIQGSSSPLFNRFVEVFNNRKKGYFRKFETNPAFKTLGVWEGNHGDFFQRIYATLRNQFLNNQIRDLPWFGGNMFATPAAALAAAVARVMPQNPRTTTFDYAPYIGKKIKIKGIEYTVTSYRMQNPKRPFIITGHGKSYRAVIELIVREAY